MVDVTGRPRIEQMYPQSNIRTHDGLAEQMYSFTQDNDSFKTQSHTPKQATDSFTQATYSFRTRNDTCEHVTRSFRIGRDTFTTEHTYHIPIWGNPIRDSNICFIQIRTLVPLKGRAAVAENFDRKVWQLFARLEFHAERFENQKQNAPRRKCRDAPKSQSNENESIPPIWRFGKSHVYT